MKSVHKTVREHGFTILELMIATIVFSTILLLCATAIIQIGRLYYKGTVTNRTQDAARSIIDEISQGIQLNGGGFNTSGPDGNGNRTFCIGDQKYSYQLGLQVKDTSTSRSAVIANTDPTCVPINHSSYIPVVNDRSLVPFNMRLANLTVVPLVGTTDYYKITVRVVYGDDDLLCSPSLNSGVKCGNNTALTPVELASQRDLICKLKTGSQFCAVSELSTTVQKRIK